MPMRINIILSLSLFLLAANAVANPNIQHWTSTNGARVYFVPAPEIPMVDIQVVFDAGSARDASKPGVALLTNGMLAEGAGDLDADAIAEKFDSLGASFSNSSHRDMSSFVLRCLTEQRIRNPAVETMALILNKPTFPENAFVREKNRVLVALKARKQSPSEIAEEAFYKGVFGNHPYASLPIGTEDSVKKLSRQDLITFQKKYFVAGNATVAVVGAVSRKEAEEIVEKIVGKLPRGETIAKIPAVENLKDSNIVQFDHPSSQTHVMVGQPGMQRSDPDYFALYLGNHILGGSGLVSWISDEIREKRGLSYSAYSYFSPMRKLGPFIIGLQTKNESTGEALKVLRNTLERFINTGPTEKELIAAKKNITGGFALRISSNKKIAEYIAMIGFYELPLDYLDTFNQNIEQVTLDRIKGAFKNRVYPDKMVTVVVGGAPKVSLVSEDHNK